MSLISDNHSFNVELAAKYSVEEALLLHHFHYWINFNARKNENFHEGRFWMYDTLENIANHFPYWSIGQVRRVIAKLEEKGLLIKGVFNKTAYDRTCWYSLSDEILKNSQAHLSKSTNGSSEIDTPIPHTKTHTKKETSKEVSSDSSSQDLANFFLKEVKAIKPDFTKGISPKWIKDCGKLLKLRSLEELKKIISWAISHSFWGPTVLSPDKLLRKLDQLELKMREEKSSPKTSASDRTQKNKEMAHKLGKQYPNSMKIDIGKESIGFVDGIYSDYILYTDSMFEEKFEKNKKRMNL